MVELVLGLGFYQSYENVSILYCNCEIAGINYLIYIYTSLTNKQWIGYWIVACGSCYGVTAVRWLVL